MKKILLFIIMLLYYLIVKRGKKKSTITDKKDYDWSKLDLGIYWFGRDNKSEKYIEGEANKYFDRNKPTVIYIHGWECGSVKNFSKETFNPKVDVSGMDIDVNCADLWIEKGWNIGIFYWTQLADESSVRDAEAKVWTNSGSKRLRWKCNSSAYNEYEGTEKSISEIFRNCYIKAMSGFNGSEIRFVGHSLGTQIAINAAKLIEDDIYEEKISSKLRPQRIALLDPFWTKGGKSYINNKWTGELCREIVKDLKNKGTVFETYKSSVLNEFWIGDSNNEMKKMTTFIKLSLDFISRLDQSTRHCAVKDWYFYSFGFKPPVETINRVRTGKEAISASTSTERLREAEDSGYIWYQDKGKNEISVTSDTYERKRWKEEVIH